MWSRTDYLGIDHIKYKDIFICSLSVMLNKFSVPFWELVYANTREIVVSSTYLLINKTKIILQRLVKSTQNLAFTKWVNVNWQ